MVRLRSRRPAFLVAWATLAAALPLSTADAQEGMGVAAGTTPGGLYYEVSGSGEPVVFIHAFSVDRRMWQPQIDAFERDFRVVRYDLRGHGRSAAPSAPYTGFDDLRELLDTLNIQRPTLVGLSAGAELAINFAIAYPSRVAGLVLAGPGLGGYKTPPLPWLAPVFEAAASGQPARAAALWADTPIMAMRSNVEAAATVGRLVSENSSLWTYKRLEQPLSPPAIDRLGEIACPTLVVVGDEDLPHIRDIADLIAHRVTMGQLVTIPRAGHIVTYDRPAAFNEALASFLESNRTSELRRLNRELFESAILRNDAGMLNAVALDELLVVPPGGVLEDKRQVLAGVRAFDVSALSLDDERVVVTGDTAIVVGKLTLDGQVRGIGRFGPLRFLSVFVRRDESWRLLARSLTPCAPAAIEAGRC